MFFDVGVEHGYGRIAIARKTGRCESSTAVQKEIVPFNQPKRFAHERAQLRLASRRKPRSARLSHVSWYQLGRAGEVGAMRRLVRSGYGRYATTLLESAQGADP